MNYSGIIHHRAIFGFLGRRNWLIENNLQTPPKGGARNNSIIVHHAANKWGFPAAVHLLLGSTRPVALALLAAMGMLACSDCSRGAERAVQGLAVLYDFQATSGDLVRDRSGIGRPLDLKIKDVRAVRREAGTLELRSGTIISSQRPAGELKDAVLRTGEITVEAWLQPADTKQAGPARIVTLSENSTQRNFTLGQEGDRFDFRLRTTRTSTNGLPSPRLAGRGRDHSADARRFHPRPQRQDPALHRRAATGRRRSGRRDFKLERRVSAGAGRRAFRRANLAGKLHLVAVYARSLSPEEIAGNYQAGSGSQAVRQMLAASHADGTLGGSKHRSPRCWSIIVLSATTLRPTKAGWTCRGRRPPWPAENPARRSFPAAWTRACCGIRSHRARCPRIDRRCRKRSRRWCANGSTPAPPGRRR